MKRLINKPVFILAGLVLMSGLLFLRSSCTKKDKDKPIAGFSIVDGYSRTIKVGDEVGFTSACVATEPFTVTWFFQGGIPATSTNRQEIVTYNYAGTFNVKLCVTDTYGLDCVESEGYITVSNSKDIVASVPAGAGDITY